MHVKQNAASQRKSAHVHFSALILPYEWTLTYELVNGAPLDPYSGRGKWLQIVISANNSQFHWGSKGGGQECSTDS